MTVSKDYNKHIYDGNGLTVAWPFDFDLPSLAGDPDTSVIRVFITDSAGEVGEITGGFSVDADTGTVTYPLVGTPLTEGEKITILRELSVTQQFFDPSNQSNLYPETLEDATDRLVMLVQQVNEDVQRAIKLPVDREATDEEVDPAAILNARDQAVSAASSASNSASAAALTEAAVEDIKNDAIDAVEDIKNDAIDAKSDAEYAASRANTWSDSAAASAVFAHGSEADAWDSDATYNFPDVIAYTDGHTYRCLGTSITGTDIPGSSQYWQRLTVEAGRTFFEEDTEGDYMPATDPSAMAGVDGESILSGATDPTGSTGNYGDKYLNEITWEFFKKTGSSTWTSLGTIKGETGIGVPPITPGSGGKVLGIKADESGYEVVDNLVTLLEKDEAGDLMPTAGEEEE